MALALRELLVLPWEEDRQVLFTLVSALSRAVREPREGASLLHVSGKCSFFSFKCFLVIKFGKHNNEDNQHQPVLTLVMLKKFSMNISQHKNIFTLLRSILQEHT